MTRGQGSAKVQIFFRTASGRNGKNSNVLICLGEGGSGHGAVALGVRVVR